MCWLINNGFYFKLAWNLRLALHQAEPRTFHRPGQQCFTVLLPATYLALHQVWWESLGPLLQGHLHTWPLPCQDLPEHRLPPCHLRAHLLSQELMLTQLSSRQDPPQWFTMRFTYPMVCLSQSLKKL